MSTTTERADTAPRLQTRYREEIVAELRDEFTYGNVMQVPRLTKIVVNMGVGDAARDSKLIEGAVRDLATITGQRPRRASPSRSSSSARASRSVLTPRFVGPGCGSSSTVS
jgi:large subunit ribosomal protein L5